ncbi:Protein timeless [Blattella germanica]|nr:Protein timeless [Blattella germanica]
MVKPSTSHGHHQCWNRQSDISGNQKHDLPSSSEMSDCGYGTQMENPESISTSSNDDEGPHSKRASKPVHQKPHNMQKVRYSSKTNIQLQDKKEWRRKKLVKRSRTTSMNMKALLHHTPTDEDISNLLKEFTVDFLLKGYGCLVQELHHQLLSNKQNIHIDTSHFFWLVTYFLKFAAQLELELDHIRPVLSFEVVSYLTFEGVNLCEQLETIALHQSNDLKPCLRRMHLVVTAIREFVQAVDTYKKITHLMQIGATEDLKCLFILLLRQYNPHIQNKQYLQDLIVTNHILLLFLDNVSKLPEYKGNTNLMDHIKQFATVEVMRQYGLLLEDFQNNGEFINDCVFTMMHHVGGDLEQTSALFQPTILKAFSQIWEMDFEICDDWSDLIEYVIHKFINTPRVAPLSPESSLRSLEKEKLLKISGDSEKAEPEWSRDDSDNLYWYYVQSSKCADPVGKVMELFTENGVIGKTRVGIIQQLFVQDVISRSLYDDLMKVELVKSSPGIPEEPRTLPSITVDSSHMDCPNDQANTNNAVVSKMEASNKIEELIVMKQSIPIVPWYIDQTNILLHQPFILLLHKLGFHLPADSGKVFARIPDFWTADVVYSIAEKLGPIDTCKLNKTQDFC